MLTGVYDNKNPQRLPQLFYHVSQLPLLLLIIVIYTLFYMPLDFYRFNISKLSLLFFNVS